MQPFGALRKCDETTDGSFWSGAGGAAVVGAGSSLIGSLISAGANNYYQKEASEANYEMQKRQLEWNEAMVEKTNKYNSPKAEYNRLLAAGINPILAKYGSNAGSASASQVPQGVNPPYNQTGVNDTGKMVGMGIGNALQQYLAFKDKERSDFALASQIDVEHMKARAQFLESVAKARNLGVHDDFLKRQIKEMDDNYWFNVDKISQINEAINLAFEVDMRRIAIEEIDSVTKRMAVENDIRMSSQQIKYLGQLILESQSNVEVSRSNSQTYASDVASQVVSRINNDAAIFEKLGLEKDLVSSTKQQNYCIKA